VQAARRCPGCKPSARAADAPSTTKNEAVRARHQYRCMPANGPYRQAQTMDATISRRQRAAGEAEGGVSRIYIAEALGAGREKQASAARTSAAAGAVEKRAQSDDSATARRFLASYHTHSRDWCGRGADSHLPCGLAQRAHLDIRALSRLLAQPHSEASTLRGRVTRVCHLPRACKCRR